MNYLMNHIRQIKIKILIILVYVSSLSFLYAQLPIQDVENTSLASESANLIDIMLGDSEITMSTQQALSITLKGRGWNYSRDTANLKEQNPPLNLAIIEENAANTQFVFYRVLEGDDRLIFVRRDTDNNFLYSYVLKVSWQDIYLQDSPLIFQDDFIEVTIMYEATGIYTPPFKDQENSTLLADTQNSNTPTMSNDADTNIAMDTTSTENTPNISTSASDKQENLSVESAKIARQPTTINMLSNNLANDEAIDELALVASNRNTDSSISILEDLETTTNNNEELVLEKAVEELLFEEFKDYISTNWQTKDFETLNSEILRWAEVNNDMFNIASIIWHYGQLLESNLTYASDIQRVYSMYKTIVDKYPLSLEYFQAQEAIESLKQYYMFVLE